MTIMAAPDCCSRSDWSFPYLAVEGCDGAGKSTIRQLLASRLRKIGCPVLEIGQHSWLDIRAARMILDARENRATFRTSDLARAYQFDKHLHVHANLHPKLTDAVVLADRCFLSDAVYQEALYGIPADQVIRDYLEDGQLLPCALVYVCVDVEVAVQRIDRRGKHRKHYEREVDLRRIQAIYERVLEDHSSTLAGKLIRFVNHRTDLEAHLSETLFSEIDRIVIHHRSTPATASSL